MTAYSAILIAAVYEVMSDLGVGYLTSVGSTDVPVVSGILDPPSGEVVGDDPGVSTCVTVTVTGVVVAVSDLGIGYLTSVGGTDVPVVSGIIGPLSGEVMSDSSDVSTGVTLGVTGMIEHMTDLLTCDLTSINITDVPMVGSILGPLFAEIMRCDPDVSTFVTIDITHIGVVMSDLGVGGITTLSGTDMPVVCCVLGPLTGEIMGNGPDVSTGVTVHVTHAII